MKFLVDTSPGRMAEQDSELVIGQLLTPLTRYANWGGTFAIDNGAFSGFDERKFRRMLDNNKENAERCLFVVSPDIVGAARRTLELFRERHRWIGEEWPVALVAQDGVEDVDLPWKEIDWLFLGGRDPWKDSQTAMDVCRTAKMLDKGVHIGRVNTIKRFKRYAAVADTCDGSGIAMYRHMLKDIEREVSAPTLFDEDLHARCD